jgi:hypothetical protein
MIPGCPQCEYRDRRVAIIVLVVASTLASAVSLLVWWLS